MDVLAPEIQIIDGICYRINPGDYSSNYERSVNHYIEPDEEDVVIEQDGEGAEEYEAEVDENGRFRLAFHVAKVYFPFIIGSKGNTRKRLEIETRTRISVPKMGRDGDIIITGLEKRNVSSARTRINMLVLSARKRQPYTHFISLPFTDTSFKKGFELFKVQVLETCSDQGVDESIFQVAERLHLTLCMLVLCDNVERNLASLALEKCKETIIRPLLGQEPLKVRLSGVEYMNDDPSEVDVLYGKIQCLNDSDILQELADNVVSYFSEEGLVENKYEKVKLHVTLMNTSFRKSLLGEEETQAKRQTFDARNILANFQNFMFGEATITSIELSLRHSSTKSGYYQATLTLKIP